MEYVIKGDTPRFDDCLVCTCGKSREYAKEVLDKMISNPSDNDKRLIKDHINLRVEEVRDEDCWWNLNCD